MTRRQANTPDDLLTRMLRDSPGALERYMLLITNAITEDATAAGRKDLFPPDPTPRRRDRRPRRRPFLREMFHGVSFRFSSISFYVLNGTDAKRAAPAYGYGPSTVYKSPKAC